MKQNEIEPAVVVRYLANEATEEETKSVEQWINAAPQNRREFKEIEKIWTRSASRPDFEKKLFDADLDWQRLKNKAEGDESASGASSLINYDISHNRFWPALTRVAAVLLVAGMIGVFAYRSWTSSEDESRKPALREISTALAQRVNLTLSDGTKVLLNAGSTLRLPETFEADRREVFLQGQAFFNVEKNPVRPFIIHSGDAQTRVLGTSFSVRAYPEEHEITVAVKEGRVSFKTADSTGEEQVILNPNELGRFDISANSIQSQPIDDMALYLGWVDGYLKFKDTPLQDVAVELERRYGVQIQFADDQLKTRSLTALLKSRSIKNVLDVISTSLNIRYRLTENEVIFSAK